MVRFLLRDHAWTMDKKPDKIVWAYAEQCSQQQLFNDLKKELGNKIQFIIGFPGTKIRNGSLFKKEKNNVLIVDDLREVYFLNFKSVIF